MKFSEKLSYLRKRKGLSQEQLANELGVSKQTVYKWEAGINIPEMNKLSTIAKMFGVSFDDLLNDDIDICQNEAQNVVLSEASEGKQVKKSVNKKYIIIGIVAVFVIALTCTIILLSVCFHKKYNKSTITPASCTSVGIIRFTCTGCDKYYDEEIPALGHDTYLYDTVDSTCTSKGRKLYKCSRCDYQNIIEIPALDHKLSTNIIADSTCEKEGKTLTTCANCDFQREEIIPKKEHSLSTTVLTEPSCTNAGRELFRCINCKYTKENEIAPLNHDLHTTVTLKATCFESGKGIIKCLRNGCTLPEEIVELPTTACTYNDKEVCTSCGSGFVPKKIMYISSFLKTTSDGSIDTTRSTSLYIGIKANGYNISTDNMYTAVTDSIDFSGYDLYIFEGVALPDVLPNDAPLWIINCTNLPKDLGVSINGSILIDNTIEIDSSGGIEIKPTITSNSSDLARLIANKSKIESFKVNLEKINKLDNLSSFDAVFGSDDFPDGLPLLAAGFYQNHSVIITSFDFQYSSLPVQVTGFPLLIRSMVRAGGVEQTE